MRGRDYVAGGGTLGESGPEAGPGFRVRTLWQRQTGQRHVLVMASGGSQVISTFLEPPSSWHPTRV